MKHKPRMFGNFFHLHKPKKIYSIQELSIRDIFLNQPLGNLELNLVLEKFESNKVSEEISNCVVC